MIIRISRQLHESDECSVRSLIRLMVDMHPLKQQSKELDFQELLYDQMMKSDSGNNDIPPPVLAERRWFTP